MATIELMQTETCTRCGSDLEPDDIGKTNVCGWCECDIRNLEQRRNYSSIRRYTPEMNDGHTIFVFGSNLAGIHGAGAAKEALRAWGAQLLLGVGRQGQAYGIPTKDQHLRTLPLDEIKKHVDQFIDYARNNPGFCFLVTEVGCGLAGYSVTEIAPMFTGCPANCVLPGRFVRLLTPNN